MPIGHAAHLILVQRVYETAEEEFFGMLMMDGLKRCFCKIAYVSATRFARAKSIKICGEVHSV